MVRWLRWHYPPDTGFEIRALAVWGRVRYLLVTEAPHNTDFHTWMGKKQYFFFQTAETGNRTPNSAWKAAVLTTTLGPPTQGDQGDWLTFWTESPDVSDVSRLYITRALIIKRKVYQASTVFGGLPVQQFASAMGITSALFADLKSYFVNKYNGLSNIHDIATDIMT